MWPREAFACREESGARLKRDAALGKREKSISSVVSSAKLPLCIFMAEEIHIRSVHRQLLPGCLRLSSQFPAKWPEKRHAPFQPTHSAVIRLMEAGVFTILCSALIFKEKKILLHPAGAISPRLIPPSQQGMSSRFVFFSPFRMRLQN